MIKDIAHICIAARNLAETERFYCEGLGLKKAFNFIQSGRVIGFYLEVGNGRFIEVFERNPLEVSPRHPILHLCLEVEDMDAVRAHLIASGIEATEKKLGSDRSWQIWATDPGGVRIEFHQYTPQSHQITRQDCIRE